MTVIEAAERALSAAAELIHPSNWPSRGFLVGCRIFDG